jgi:hypothetical protein
MAELGLLAGDIFLKFLQIYMLLTSIVPGVYEEVSGESDHGMQSLCLAKPFVLLPS